MADDDDLVMAVARLIWKRGITINEFYDALGVDLERYRADNADDVVTRLAGIFEGWSSSPNEPED